MHNHYRFLWPGLFLLMLVFHACEKEYLAPKKVEINEPVSFSQQVLPIMVAECGTPSCHVSGGPSPNLTQSKAYSQLTGLGYVDTTNAENSIVYKLMISTTNPMPPAGNLPPEEIGYILAWIKQGAQNN